MAELSYTVSKISPSSVIKPFDCGDEDLNDFLLNDSINYHKELLAITYVLENKTETIAFFSLLNDVLRVEDIQLESISKFKKLLKKFVSYPKRHLRSFPAIKIGRLAVSSLYQNAGLGKTILEYVIGAALHDEIPAACKFLTVDAYAKSVPFYKKNGFDFITIKDEKDETRQMFLDLTPYANTLF